VLAVFRLHSSSLKAHDVTARKCLRDGKADELLSSKNIWNDARFEFFTAKVEDGRKANNFSTE
jgi:hypothetical protein